MKQRNVLVFLMLILLSAGCLFFAKTKSVQKSDSLGVVSADKLPTHPLVHFEEQTFYPALSQIQQRKQKFTYHVSGGIIPHHLFASFMIADFLQRLSGQQPKTIILLGPDHYERGSAHVITSLYGWETPAGIVMPNKRLITKLLEKGLVQVDEHTVPADHAVAGIMPFIKEYLPETQVVPLLLSSFQTKTEIQTLAAGLQNVLDEETVLIAAVDFSHYLNNQQAQAKDKITLETLQSFNYDRLLTFNHDFLDSPPSIATLLMVMQGMGTTTMDVLHHSNSGEMQQNDVIETTSYFSIAYY